MNVTVIVFCYYSSALKMEAADAACSFRMYVNVYQTTLHHVPEDRNLFYIWSFTCIVHVSKPSTMRWVGHVAYLGTRELHAHLNMKISTEDGVV
jgi:hypothetical protein